MYPLNMQSKDGFAVASDEVEHQSLSDIGYEPKLVLANQDVTVESVQAQLDTLGIVYDKRLGLAKLLELLPA